MLHNQNGTSSMSDSLVFTALQMGSNGSNTSYSDCLYCSDGESYDFDNMDVQKMLEIAEYLFNTSKQQEHHNGTHSHDIDYFKLCMDYLTLYLTPVIILVGLIGNLVSFLVFSLTYLHRLSSSVYLASLAVVDSGFLIVLFFVWLSRFNIPIFHQPGWCQLLIYLSHVFVFLSVWNVVSFTAERYIIVFHPLKKESFCTKRKARRVVGGLVILSFIVYAFVPATSGVVVYKGDPVCMPKVEYYNFLTITILLDTMFACIIPSIIIVILNVKIILQLQRHQYKQTALASSITTLVEDKKAQGTQGTQRRSVIHTSVSMSGSMHIKFSGSKSNTPDDDVRLDNERGRSSQRKRAIQDNCTSSTVTTSDTCQRLLRSRTQFRTAKMLLILSSAFVILNLPSHIFKVNAFVRQLFGSEVKLPKDGIFWQELFQLVYFLNFSINFFIYSMCGRQFRVGLVRLKNRFLQGSNRSHVRSRGYPHIHNQVKQNRMRVGLTKYHIPQKTICYDHQQKNIDIV